MHEAMYLITYVNGETQEEFGNSVADVRDFISRCFKFQGPIKSIQLLH